jgi:hypothetical protein
MPRPVNPNITKVEINKSDLIRFQQAKLVEELKTGVRLLQPDFLSLIINDGIKSRGLLNV